MVGVGFFGVCFVRVPGLAGVVCDGWRWGCRGLLFEICIVDASIFVAIVVFVVCVASYEGHMVDALASRADEGRSSLR